MTGDPMQTPGGDLTTTGKKKSLVIIKDFSTPSG
jgi:hypothetical protein